MQRLLVKNARIFTAIDDHGWRATWRFAVHDPGALVVDGGTVSAVGEQASILRQMHHPFEIVYGHPDDKDTMQQL